MTGRAPYNTNLLHFQCTLMSLRDIYLCQEVNRRKSEREEPPSSPHLLAQDQGVQGLQQVQASDHAEGVLPGEEDDG